MPDKEYVEKDAVVAAVPTKYAAVIRSIPAADVSPVVRSRWEINCDGYYPYCMNCKKEPPGRVMTDFCPNCGADMRGAQTDV